ncbi:MAG: thymidylate kinase [Acidobacteria bacterium]|nr:thymidylate kinase [Acidobacteriota bacterium]MBI3662840.1 thymidylate kinase [Acidobacteriota bacterium]
MIVHNKFLAMEGIDGAGKRTQIDLLCKLLEERGVAFTRFSFPRYNSFFGRMVARFLNGEFGRLPNVDAHFSALLFAGDRLEAKEELERALDKGRVVVADRYIGSNLAHQGARVPEKDRAAFIHWLSELEYRIYGLPAEELVVYLRVPAARAQRLVERKAKRDYTCKKKDLQEADLKHLESAAKVYDRLAEGPHWLTIECFDAAAGKLRPPDEIHQELAQRIEARAGFLVRRKRR